MSPSPQLAPAGSSTYASNTLHVGDGTWDSSRDTFLLPNLMGVNFDTMRYNGMGNRFRNMPGYAGIIRAHGAIAALTFLGIVPAAIFFAKFYHKNPRLALRIHIWLHILTLMLTTVVFALGFFAVGRPRSLTNPHHGIGLAIYVLVIFQVLFGSFVHRMEKNKELFRLPLKVMLHQWLGRGIALLGIIQIPLGLTLYGSPKALFIIFAVWAFLLFLLYFVLSFINRPHIGFDDRGSYVSGTVTDVTTPEGGRGKHRLGLLAAAGAGAGLAAMRRRSRSRSRSRRRTSSHGEVLSSHRPSHRHSESYYDEKYTDDGHGQHTWRNRLLGAAAGLGGLAALKGIFGKKNKEGQSEVSSHYAPRPLGHRPQSPSETDISRVEEGRVPASPITPANDRWRREEERTSVAGPAGAAFRPSTGSPSRVGRRRRSGESISSWEASETDVTPSPKKNNGGHAARNALAAVGIAGIISKFRNRNKDKEDRRVEELRQHEQRENERINRYHSQRRKYTGDGGPPPRRNSRRHSLDSYSDVTSTDVTRTTLPPPRGANAPRVPLAPVSDLSSRATVVPGASGIGPPPMGEAIDSGSEEYFSTGGGRHHRHRMGSMAAAAAAGAAVGAAAAKAGSSKPHGGSSVLRSDGADSVSSPPVSVKVKMHGDGRHVTLRRLNEEEAAAERARKRTGNGKKQRTSSLSSVEESDNGRWRRIEAMEAAQAAQNAAQGTSAGPIIPPPPPPPGPPPVLGMPGGMDDPYYPPPPPIPGTVTNSVASSRPYETGTNTDVSAYDSNRRRRRAERARAQAAKGGSGSRVDFT